MVGETGNDIYIIERGEGVDIVDNIGEGASSDKIVFGANIDTDQLWFSQDGNDLWVDIVGSDDRVIIDEWYTNSNNHVDLFETSDGSTLDNLNVTNLVSAMAAFSSPSFGETELSQALHTSLDTVIAANWESNS